jgi:hypothetical protein
MTNDGNRSPVIQARAGREWERGGRGRGVVSLFLDHGCAGEGSGRRLGAGGKGPAGPRARGLAGPRRVGARAGVASPLLFLIDLVSS